MRRLLTRVFLAVSLASIPACGRPSSDREASMDSEVVPSDPTSIARWESGQGNVFRSKLEVVPLRCFRDRLTERGHAETKPVVIEIVGGLDAGVAGEPSETLRRFAATEPELYARVRAAIYDEYRKSYSSYKQAWSMGAAMFGGDEINGREVLPEIVKGNELDGLVSFRTIYVSRPENGMSRIGIVLACPWDEEHGMGVVIANGDVERVSDAGTALLSVMPKSGNRPDQPKHVE